MKAIRFTVLLTLVCALALPGGATAVAGSSGTISNERTITYWAHPESTAAIRVAPRASARAIVDLHWLTEDGYPEVYVVLAQRLTAQRTWFKIGIPGRPNGRTGWVPASALGTLHLVHTEIVVDERTLRLTLYRDGRKVFTAPVGIGAPGTPTPQGTFWVREKFRAQGGIYGPYALGTSDYSVLSDWPRGGVIGIHGTDEPALIPGHPSHGCVRLTNGEVTKLYPLVPIGTPVHII